MAFLCYFCLSQNQVDNSEYPQLNMIPRISICFCSSSVEEESIILWDDGWWKRNYHKFLDYIVTALYDYIHQPLLLKISNDFPVITLRGSNESFTINITPDVVNWWFAESTSFLGKVKFAMQLNRFVRLVEQCSTVSLDVKSTAAPKLAELFFHKQSVW